jgi:hypothetical protein
MDAHGFGSLSALENPKFEFLNSKQTAKRMSNWENPKRRIQKAVWNLVFFGHLNLFRASDFVLVVSRFQLLCKNLILASVIVVVVLRMGFRIKIVARNRITLFGPGTEIDQLATVRAKRPVWIILPRRFLLAIGTFDCKRHGRLRN